MKVFCFFFLIILSSCASQTTIHCYNEANKNIVYTGVVAPLNISSNKKIVSITSDKAIIKKGSNDNIYTLITNQTESLFVEVKTKNKIEKFYFRVEEIPEPIINFDRPIHSNEIKIDDFKTLKTIRCFIPEIAIDIRLRIKSFEIIRITKDNLVFRETCKIHESRLIPAAQVGDIYFFNDIIIDIGESYKTIKKNEILKIID